MTSNIIATEVAPASVELANLSMIDEGLRKRLVGRIVTDEGLPEDLAERILDQALGYLRLASEQPKGHFSPSPLVDIGWHTFILYTRSYDAFCRELTGGNFIHHEPTDDDSVPNRATGPNATMEAMKNAGIVVDEPLWAHFNDGDCTASDGDGDQGCKCGPCNY
jgi:hypothetical protein